MSNGNGHSWSKFFWRDWQSESALRLCDLAAQGFWMRMLCLMHEADKVGCLLVNGARPEPKEMAVIFGCTEREAIKHLATLEKNRVFSRHEDGTIYCRRMVKDAATSEVGREFAAKRWKGPHPNGSPNGSPNGRPNGLANGAPTGIPNAKNLEAEEEAEEEAGKQKQDFKKDFLNTNLEVGFSARGKTAPPVSPQSEDEGLERSREPTNALGDALGNHRRMKNYPPRNPVRGKWEQIDATTPKPKLRDVSFTREQINSLRRTA